MVRKVRLDEGGAWASVEPMARRIFMPGSGSLEEYGRWVQSRRDGAARGALAVAHFAVSSSLQSGRRDTMLANDRRAAGCVRHLVSLA
jgi:hypothetical protein